MLKELYVPNTNGFGYACNAFGMADDIENTYWGPGLRDVYIIHFVIHGKGYVNGHEVCENQGFILYPNQVHEYHADKKDPWHYFWISLIDQNAPAVMEKYGIPLGTDFFQFRFQNNFIASYKKLFDCSQVTITQDFFTGLLGMILSFVQVDIAPSQVNRGKSHVDHAMEMINSNYHLRIKISDIAERLFLDPGYLYNLFMKYAGISPKEYLNNVRIQKACELLSKTDYLVSEISCSVGYDDPLQFSKFFKSRIGMSPLDYRSLEQKKNIAP